MIDDITIITPPDFLHNNSFNLLVVCPGTLLKNSLNDSLKSITVPLNLLVYESMSENVGWLLTAAKMADCTIFDVDNADHLTRQFASLIIANPNTFYLTSTNTIPYNLISKNRVYDLAWLDLIINRGTNEES